MGLKKYLFIFSFFIILKSNSQIYLNHNPYWKGEIVLVDGTIKKGYIKVPHKVALSRILFKKSLEGKKEVLKRKMVKSVTVNSPNGKKFLYETTSHSTVKSNHGYGNFLMLVKAKNNYVTFYIASGSYKVDKKTDEILLYYQYNNMTDFPTVSWYIKKRNAKTANLFYITAYIGGFKRSARHHLTEDPVLLEKIETNQLTDLNKIISTFIKTTENM